MEGYRVARQRVALARALVNNAGLIIVDEPTVHFTEMSYEIVDLLNHINAKMEPPLEMGNL